jgi:hypothetical protein
MAMLGERACVHSVSQGLAQCTRRSRCASLGRVASPCCIAAEARSSRRSSMLRVEFGRQSARVPPRICSAASESGMRASSATGEPPGSGSDGALQMASNELIRSRSTLDEPRNIDAKERN